MAQIKEPLDFQGHGSIVKTREHTLKTQKRLIKIEKIHLPNHDACFLVIDRPSLASSTSGNTIVTKLMDKPSPISKKSSARHANICKGKDTLC